MVSLWMSGLIIEDIKLNGRASSLVVGKVGDCCRPECPRYFVYSMSIDQPSSSTLGKGKSKIGRKAHAPIKPPRPIPVHGVRGGPAWHQFLFRTAELELCRRELGSALTSIEQQHCCPQRPFRLAQKLRLSDASVKMRRTHGLWNCLRM